MVCIDFTHITSLTKSSTVSGTLSTTAHYTMYYAYLDVNVATSRIIAMYATSSDYNSPCFAQRLTDTKIRAFGAKAGSPITIKYTYI